MGIGSEWGFEGLDPDVNWRGCRLEGLDPDGDWKGWIQTAIGRDSDWKDLDVVAGFEGTLLLLIVPIDVVVDCSKRLVGSCSYELYS